MWPYFAAFSIGPLLVDRYEDSVKNFLTTTTDTLFNDKIGDNIKYGRMDATEEEVQKAATEAEIHKRIMEMDEKYDTKVGNRDLKLSGGQRQISGIARVFQKRPKIVVLDEATSALDTITEKKIQSALEKTCHGRTSLIIAHRLSTVCHADKILVLQGGKVVEEGNHMELLDMRGMYAKLWEHQMEAAEPADQEKKRKPFGEEKPTGKKRVAGVEKFILLYLSTSKGRSQITKMARVSKRGVDGCV